MRFVHEEQPLQLRLNLLLSLLLLVLALTILGLYLDAQREGRVSRANAERIMIGMTEAKVERLLGGCASMTISTGGGPLGGGWCQDYQAWHTCSGAHVGVYFQNGVVTVEPSFSADSDLWILDWLRSRLGL